MLFRILILSLIITGVGCAKKGSSKPKKSPAPITTTIITNTQAPCGVTTSRADGIYGVWMNPTPIHAENNTINTYVVIDAAKVITVAECTNMQTQAKVCSIAESPVTIASTSLTIQNSKSTFEAKEGIFCNAFVSAGTLTYSVSGIQLSLTSDEFEPLILNKR